MIQYTIWFLLSATARHMTIDTIKWAKDIMRSAGEVVSHTCRSFAMTLLFCLSMGEIYGQDPLTAKDTLRPIDTLQRSEAKKVGDTIMPYSYSHRDQVLNNSIQKKHPDFEIDMIESTNGDIRGLIIRQHNPQWRNHPSKVYHYDIDGLAMHNDYQQKQVLSHIEKQIIPWVQRQERDILTPLTREQIDKRQKMKERYNE